MWTFVINLHGFKGYWCARSIIIVMFGAKSNITNEYQHDYKRTKLAKLTIPSPLMTKVCLACALASSIFAVQLYFKVKFTSWTCALFYSNVVCLFMVVFASIMLCGWLPDQGKSREDIGLCNASHCFIMLKGCFHIYMVQPFPAQ